MAPAPTSLSREIFRACTLSTFPTGEMQRKFLPQGELERIVTRESVIRELEYQSQCQDDSVLVNFILEKAKKLFAISLMSQVQDLNYTMELFRKHEISDKNLPAPTSETETSSSLEQCFKLWDPIVQDDFINTRQWMFLAPVFSVEPASASTLTPLDFEQGIIFPFIETGVPTMGGFGVVYKVKVHRSHLCGSPDDPILKVKNKDFFHVIGTYPLSYLYFGHH